MRSRAAAGILEDAGLSEVASMEGGIKAWQGMVAHGGPEAGMPYFSPGQSTGEIMVLAWVLEEGSRRFYAEVVTRFTTVDAKAHELFSRLVVAEEHHKEHLLSTYHSITGEALDPQHYHEKFGEALTGEIMEGGVRVAEALAWAEGQGLAGTLELAMSLEINSFDLYVKMGRKVTDDPSRQVFKALAAEEQAHLQRLSELLDQHLA